MKKIIGIVGITVIIDQIVKYFISDNMEVYQSFEVISNFFNITYVRNNGAAFSILDGSQLFLIIIALVSMYLIYKYLIKGKKLNDLNVFIYSILFGGIIGNLIDRIIHGYVIDYLDFKIFNYNFPIFNIADICIVIGCSMLVIITSKEDQYENKSSKRR